MKANNAASWLIIITLIVMTLLYGQSIIVPFIVAVLIWFVVKKTRNMIDKIGFVHRYIPKWIKTALATFLIFGTLVLIGKMLTDNIEKIVASYKSYEPNIQSIAQQINDILKIDIEEEMNSYLHEDAFTSYLSSIFNSISEILGSMVMVLFYTLFLFAEENLFQRKMQLIFTDHHGYSQFSETMLKIDKMLSSYISLKSLVSFITAGVSYILLLIIGIESPFFWATLIFLMNFIPSIGSIIATLLPAIFALIQFGSFIQFSIILFVVGGIQVVVGNYVEPRLMGNTLNISPLVAIIALAVWGAIWGITGMLLSVPITVALIIILSQFPNTRPVAILLSEKGKV